jgi:hypothetical protein
MNIKITYHIMPWEIDYALLTFTQLKKSKYYLPPDVNITIDSALNLSSYLINWDESKLPKEYFIEKYKQLSLLLKDYNHNPKIYDGNELYGHLDLQRDCISPEIDYYMGICPDMYFSEYLLSYIIQAAQSIPNKYFILTTQIGKLWDSSWDILTHKEFCDYDYKDWETSLDIFDIDNYLHTTQEDINVSPIDQFKWAGWFDLYNKAFFEEIAPVPQDWKGYGGWDLYSMHSSYFLKEKLNQDVQQYILNNQIVFPYGIGPLRVENLDGFMVDYYRKLMVKNDLKYTQSKEFNQNVPSFIQQNINNLIFKFK